MKKIKLLGFTLLFTSLVVAQNDSSKRVGTIKISKISDTLYIQVSVDWKISHKSADGDFTFTSISKVNEKINQMGPQNNDMRTVIAPSPNHSNEKFDFENYFQKNRFTKQIKLRKGESDIVTYYVSVNKFGRVHFFDPSPVEKLGDTIVVYTNDLKKEYKVDVVHEKTKKAFVELTKSRWRPAKIKELKKHPSKRSHKYRRSTGFTQGTITIQYSSSPFKD